MHVRTVIRKLNLEYYDGTLTEILHLYSMNKTTFNDTKEVYRMRVNFYHELDSRPGCILWHNIQITSQSMVWGISRPEFEF